MDVRELRNVFAEFFRARGRFARSFAGRSKLVVLAMPADGVRVWFHGCPRSGGYYLTIEVNGDMKVVRGAVSRMDERLSEVGSWKRTEAVFLDTSVSLVVSFGLSPIDCDSFSRLLEAVFDLATEV